MGGFVFCVSLLTLASTLTLQFLVYLINQVLKFLKARCIMYTYTRCLPMVNRIWAHPSNLNICHGCKNSQKYLPTQSHITQSWVGYKFLMKCFRPCGPLLWAKLTYSAVWERLSSLQTKGVDFGQLIRAAKACGKTINQHML